jgi:sugar lactone lactonase YvrE
VTRVKLAALIRMTCLAAVCAVLAVPSAIRAQGTPSVVRTVAGSAAAGIKDGPALEAQFLVPSGLARARDGTLYISDPAAQRIRQMLPDGTVRTAAGSGSLGPLLLSVAGGYRDGPAAEAAFDGPAGLAIGPDGALYIADSFNACIRKLQNGVVSTVVGKPGESRATDGTAATGRLALPLSISFDKSGTLWIADYGAGLRTFANGELHTIALKSYGDLQLTSVSAEPEDDGAVIAATSQLVYVYDRRTHTDTYVGVLNDGEDGPVGRPSQVLAIGDGQALFTDARNNNVRYLRLPKAGFDTTLYTRTIAGGELEKGIFNAGFADGPVGSARFASPRGLALAGGSVIVADAGNHRLRSVALPAFRRSEAGLNDAYRYDQAHFEVVYVSASNAFWDTIGDDSICAHIERSIDAAHRVAKPARCHTVRIDAAQLPQVESYITTALTFRHIDALVIGANPFAAGQYAGAGGVTPGAPALHASMAALVQAIKPTGARLVLMWLSDNFFFSDDENLISHETSIRFFPDATASTVAGFAPLFASLRDLPIAQYDTFKDFLDYERQPDHLPLFVNPGTHLNPRGNRFLGEHLAAYLLDSGIAK